MSEFPDRLRKSLPTGYEDTVESMQDDEINSARLKCQEIISSIKKEMKADKTLQAAKDLVKEKSEPYRDVIKTQEAKIEYLLYVLEGRGRNLAGSQDIDNDSNGN